MAAIAVVYLYGKCAKYNKQNMSIFRVSTNIKYSHNYLQNLFPKTSSALWTAFNFIVNCPLLWSLCLLYGENTISYFY